MASRLSVLAVVVCLVLAGCSTFSAGDRSPTPTVSQASEDAAPAGSGQADVTNGADTDPWPGSPTIVAIEGAVGNRSVEPLVAESLSYWEANDERYGRYTTTFDLRPNATDPDVVVEFVANLDTCGYERSSALVGCTPILGPDSNTKGPATVQIEAGYTDASTLFALKHELGHLFGLNHGDKPQRLMEARADSLVRLPEPNVTDRAYTWRKQRLAVYADRDRLPGTKHQIDRQLRVVIDYYNDGANGTVPANLTLEVVRDPTQADIVVTSQNLSVPSNETLLGKNTDSDPALEFFTEQTIVVDRDLPPERLGWHVGFWLGDSLLGTRSTDDLPPPFDEPRTDDRTEWW